MKLPPVMFVHGMWADEGHWNRFRRGFSRSGFDTHAVTLLGHEAPQDMQLLRTVGIMDFVSQVRHEIDSLPEAPVLVGHSMGALVAQKLAESVRLRCLVLLAPVAPRGVMAVTPSALACTAPNVLDACLRRPFIIPFASARFGILNALPPRQQLVVYRSFLWESGKALREVISGAVSVNELNVKAPVLVMVGSQDRATPVTVVRRIASKYGADLREYVGECHFLSASRDVIQDVVDWVRVQVGA